ncbi:MAG: hypothetical protein NZ889_01375 [Candidatus Pacearchaeota archaeon]|nr:hypothetical protein [Candidatus Pacearchaeota archaeon]
MQDNKDGLKNQTEKIKTEQEQESKKKFYFLIKNWSVFVILILLGIVSLAVFIRTQNIPYLKDVTTGNYTLGPDLDPFFYARVAKEIVIYGKPLDPDRFRAAPLGIKASYNLHCYLMAYLYKLVSLFYKGFDMMLAFIISPVVFFAFAIIFFFLFSRKLFSFVMEKKRAEISALIATAFFAIAPEMLHRTTAGIPEHESSGVMFMFLAFYLFLCAWSSKGKKALLFSIVSGLSTACMLSAWTGGARYIFMIIGLSVFLAFLFEKIGKKEFLIYLVWFLSSLILLKVIPSDVSITSTLKSISDVGFALAILILLSLDRIYSTKIQEKIKTNLPRSIIVLGFFMIIALVFALAIDPGLINSLFNRIVEGMLYPFGRGRIALTVAENRAPFLVDLITNFSPMFFWLFFFGSLFLFYETIKHFENKKVKRSMFVAFVIFIFFFLFSRYSATSILNGENTISKILYFSGLGIFLFVLLYNYTTKDKKDFQNVNFAYIFILSSLFWSFVSIRGAIRLFFIISPFVTLPVSFLPTKLSEYVKGEETKKIAIISVVIVLSLLLLTAFIKYEKITRNAARWTIPSAYNQQWQRAMAWVRENTPKEAIFVHWWDYGYWIQSIGERPTVTDGGHHTPFWDHTTARYLMTAQNEKTALQLCKAHNVSYFLIDSTEIGKYPAYSSIGSDETGKDRLSWISTFILDEKQTQETRNETLYIYVGGTLLDQDIIYKGQVFPMEKAGIVAFIVSIRNNEIKKIEAILIYNQQQFKIPIKYYYYEKMHILEENENALKGALYFVPTLTQKGINKIGAAMYLSEKALNALWVKLYLLNESKNFELIHKEDSLLIKQLREDYNIKVGDFIIANEFHGPIKIFKVNHENVPYHEEYLQRSGWDDVKGPFASLDHLGT